MLEVGWGKGKRQVGSVFVEAVGLLEPTRSATLRQGATVVFRSAWMSTVQAVLRRGAALWEDRWVSCTDRNWFWRSATGLTAVCEWFAACQSWLLHIEVHGSRTAHRHDAHTRMRVGPLCTAGGCWVLGRALCMWDWPGRCVRIPVLQGGVARVWWICGASACGKRGVSPGPQYDSSAPAHVT